MADQRARTIAPRLGVAPMPTAHTKYNQCGAPPLTAASRVATESTVTAAVGRSTRDWPYLSTSLETCGPTAAPDSATVADSAPASPYCPVTCETIVTMPIPSM